MTRKELEYVKKVLKRIKNSDEHIEKATIYVEKDLKQYDSRIGQLKNQYETDLHW